MSPSNQLHQQLSTLLDQENWPQLAIACRAALIDAPTDPEVHFLLGNALAASGSPTEALIALQTACDLVRDNREYRLALADCFLELEQADQALVNYQSILEIDPFDQDALVSAALVLANNGNDSEADALLKRARERYPDEPFVLNACGEQLVAHGQYQEAQACFEQAIEADPQDPTAYERLATLYYDLDEAEEAEAVLLEGCEHAEDLTEGHLTLGQIYLEQERIPDAIRHFERFLAAEIDPAAEDLRQDVRAILEDLKKEH